MRRTKKPDLYKKTFTRDFSLGVIQLWAAGESTDPRQWTTKKQPFLPYVVFWRKNGMVQVYVNHKGIEWCKAELMKIVKSDPRFVQRVGDECRLRFNTVKPALVAKKALSLPELETFTNHIRKFWAWFEALWWLIEALESQPKFKKDLALLLSIRGRTQDLAAGANLVIRASLAKAYPRFSNYVDVISIEEATRKKIPSVSVLKRRLNEFIYADKRLLVPNAHTNIEREFNIRFESIKPTTVNVFKGQIAFKGKVQGYVRVLFGTKQMAMFKKGEILVAPMTIPDLLPAMKKAAAFVTDEGGIVSHAAITARELKKPCIIGTKIATQVLKDGDLVEVDANKGIIRKINSIK